VSSLAALPGIGGAVLAGRMSSEEAVRFCLERIEQSDGATRSFVSLQPERALEEARQRDAAKHSKGPLHGVPFAVKDIFDSADLPTEFNSPIYKGYRPAKDAAAVALMRAGGGVFLGKVSTAELPNSLREDPPQVRAPR
jgi:Asp-tRNA(Asn)/Glu-tRNA(Gln) amidotransferase A subunit family amidase